MRRLGLALAACLSILLAAPAGAEGFLREELRIPMAGTPKGLAALLIRPEGSGRYPLAIFNHGAPRKPEDRTTMGPRTQTPQAMEFARRGWAAVILMRRGYGGTGGEYAETNGPCNSTDYIKSGTISSDDLRTAIGHLSKRNDIDPSRIISVGQSAGGFATVALTAKPPRGLVAAINFAGGRGSRADDDVCQEDLLVEAFRHFGKSSRVPMLWVYSQNDRFFGPALAPKFHAAFTAGGGVAEFVKAPAVGEDGHSFFARAIPQWTPIVDAFLKKHSLVLREKPLALPSSLLAAPGQLSAKGREEFDKYRTATPHKAFAVTPTGTFGWKANRPTLDEAKAEALETCTKHSKSCRVVFADDETVP
jgi:dienelactone hydrolase